MGQARLLRMQLFRMRPFILACKSRTLLLSLLDSRMHYLDGIEVWALADFQRVRDGARKCMNGYVFSHDKLSNQLSCWGSAHVWLGCSRVLA